MLYFLEEVYLLEHLTFAEVILHIILLDGLDGHLLPCKLVNTKGYLAEGSFANQLDELVKVQCCRRQFIILLDILLYVLDQLVPLLQDGVIDLRGWLRVQTTTVLVTGVLGRADRSTVRGVAEVDALVSIALLV